MRKVENFSDKSLGMKRRAKIQVTNNSNTLKGPGTVFQGWKRYEEAEEEE